MTKNVLKYLVIPIMSFLMFGIFIQHHLSKPNPPKKLLCDEGNLLSQIDGTGSVYTRVSGLSCNYDKGTLIISDKSNRVALSIE
jgi:hypothetical protein